MIKYRSIFLLLFVISVLSCNEDGSVSVESDEDLYLHVLSTDSSNFTQARFALHLPETQNHLNGIFVIVPGLNFDGRSYKDAPVFRIFADTNNFAIVSCYFEGFEGSSEYWKSGGGSGDALKRVIDEFALISNRPQLSTLPILIWGHSAGGQFSYSFTALNPERVAACVTVRSGSFTTSPNEGTLEVPVLFLLGEYDVVQWNESALNFCKLSRRLGAKWLYAIEPGVGHDVANSNYLALPFLKHSLQLRLVSEEKHYNNLIALEEESGWLGNYNSFDVSRHNNYSGFKLEAAWLPDSTLASKWKNYELGIF